MMVKQDFSHLDPLIKKWDIDTVSGRIRKRTESTLQEMQEFHDAMLEKLITFLNQFPVEGIPQEYQPLKNAVLCMLHVDRPVNKWKNVLLEEARDPRLFQMKSSFYDSERPDNG